MTQEIPAHIASVIETSIPLPKPPGPLPGFSKYEPMRYLKVGESFFVTGTKLSSARQGAQTFARRVARGARWAFAVAEKDGVQGVRIWRTK
jgi:hypothetical protein